MCVAPATIVDADFVPAPPIDPLWRAYMVERIVAELRKDPRHAAIPDDVLSVIAGTVFDQLP